MESEHPVARAQTVFTQKVKKSFWHPLHEVIKTLESQLLIFEYLIVRAQ